MKTTADYLDQLRARLVCSSDAEVGERMKWKPAQVSRYRRLISTFNDTTALRVAELCDDEPEYVFACMRVQKAKEPTIKAIWQRAAESLGKAASVAALAIGAATLGMPSPAQAAVGGFNNCGIGASGIHIARRTKKVRQRTRFSRALDLIFPN